MKRRNYTALLLGLGSFAACALQGATPTLTGEDVGGPVLTGSTVATTEADGSKVYTVTGGGADIWGTADAFHYAYFKVTGDFDYVVQVRDLQGPDGWTKAELMARLFDDSGVPQAGDPHISNMTTRSGGQNELRVQFRTARDGASDGFNPAPAVRPSYPNVWLRTERLGNVFYLYYGTDGKNWTLYSPASTLDTAGSDPAGSDGATRFTEAWPKTVALGLAVTAHNDSDATGGIGVFANLAPHVTVPIAITTQPAAKVDVAANTKLSLSVVATGDPVHYQWRKDGKDIAGATKSVYEVALAQVADSGTYSVRLFGAGTEVISGNSVVSVTQDVTPPQLTGVAADGSFTRVTVTFSEPVNATAEAKANYTLDNGATVSGVTRLDSTRVALTVSRLAEGQTYQLKVSGVQDTANPVNTIAANSAMTFHSFVWVPNVVIQKYWDNITVNSVATLTNDARFPNQPTSATLEPMFEYPAAGGSGPTDYYGNQLSGWFIPPQTGDYVFFLCADDYAQLYLSTDDSPANMALIASESAWSNSRQWVSSGGGSDTTAKRSDQYMDTGWPTGNTITLTKGKKYYIEARHSEGSGGDNVGVTYILATDADPADSTAPALTGSVIGAYLDPNGASVNFTQQPADTTVAQNRAATFTAAATGTSALPFAVSYQWQQAAAGSTSFTDIAGATKATYTTPQLTLADSGMQYRVIASVPTLSVTSSAAKVTVSNDSTPPMAIAAGALKGATSVGVTFDEQVDATSAALAANYKVNGATPASAIPHFNKYVELQLASPLTANFTVTVAGVKDLAGNAMTSATVAGTLSDMTATDIGDPGVNPIQAGYTVALGNDGYIVAGGGSDIWDAADACQLAYKEFTGAFDLRTRVEAMNAKGPDNTTTWAKAELMVRESTAAGAIHNSVCVTRADGENAIEAQWRDTTDGTSGNLRITTPVPYPNAWLRLVRKDAASGSIELYTSTDGATWKLVNTHVTPALAQKVLVGLAVTSHDNTGTDILAQGLYQSFTVKPYTAVVDPQLKAVSQNGKMVISWAAGTLVSSPTVKGTYAPVAGATSPFTVTPETGKTVFYQVQQ